MNFNWRKWNRVIHRDLGYFFFGMTVIYAISGIALNHTKSWNPSYSITQKQARVKVPASADLVNRQAVGSVLEFFKEENNYKKHYFPAPGHLKIFFTGGSIEVNMETGTAFYEKLVKRPFLYEINFLHYNPQKLWTWFSDIFSFSLFLIALSGLFILKGKKGISGRGAWLTAAGILIPLLLLIWYL